MSTDKAMWDFVMLCRRNSIGFHLDGDLITLSSNGALHHFNLSCDDLENEENVQAWIQNMLLNELPKIKPKFMRDVTK